MVMQANDDRMLRMPVVQEELELGRERVETGSGVRLNKHVTEETWRVDDAVLRQHVEVEHIPVNAWVEGALPTQRQEGGSLVIPVLEEVLVVQKRVRLKEEIRITVRDSTEPVSQTVVLRSEQIDIERFDDARAPPRDPTSPPATP